MYSLERREEPIRERGKSPSGEKDKSGSIFHGYPFCDSKRDFPPFLNAVIAHLDNSEGCC